MKSSGSSAYEVRCPSCDVSFPPETRRCFHCGAGLSQAGRRSFSARSEGAVVSDVAKDDPSAGTGSWLDLQDSEETPDEESPARPGWFRFGGSLIWVLLALLASLGQMCEGG